jgi:hypothetical protein
MIKITAEIWPFGSKEDKREVFELKVANDGMDSGSIRNYRYSLSSSSNGEHYKELSGKITSFPRKHLAGALRLLYLILRDIFEETQLEE